MSNHMRLIICPPLFAVSLIAAACSGPVGGVTATPFDNRHQCRSLDWRQAGIADGIRGYDDIEDRFTALANNCSQHGATPDREDYDAGYAEGRRRAGA